MSTSRCIRQARTFVLTAAALAAAVAPLEAQTNETAIVGRVIESASGEPVNGAEVLLPRSSRVKITGEAGLFRFEGVSPGPHLIAVRHLGLESKQFPVRVSRGRTLDVSFQLETRILPVPELVVTVSQTRPVSKLTGFYRRKENNAGYFLTREQIDEMSLAESTDIFRRVPGVRVSRSAGATRTPVTMGRVQGCYPRFYLDGSYVSYFDMDNLLPRDIAALEIYRGNSEVPLRFKHGDRCGVIVIWTRSP